jgi:hypothetical protein
MKHAVRAVLQRILLVVADRWNYFLVRGMYHPNSRFDHRAFLGGSDWGKSRDMVRFATVDLLRREIAEWGVDGAVAELGVGVGTFAAMLNHYFPERTIYHSAWSMSTSASTNPPTPVCGGSIRAWPLVGICS